tara:strand:- start:6515 stop:7210 length:696 start_codon:yes stop_codon:yes gene_type:complete
MLKSSAGSNPVLSASQRIPRVIHQMHHSVSDLVKTSQATIADTNPHWEYRFWSDDDVYSFIEENYDKDIFDYWDSYGKKNIRRWDIARYLLVGKLGGMYVDADVVFYNNVDQILDLNNRLIFRGGNGKKNLKNHFFLSAPEEPFWDYLIEDIRQKWVHDVHKHTGGKKLYYVLENYRSEKQINPDSIQILKDNYVINTDFVAQPNLKYFNRKLVYIEHLVLGSWKKKKKKK